MESDEEGRKTLSLMEIGERREEFREGSQPVCLICDCRFDEISNQITPIDSLEDCPVQEVRSALAFGGTELAAFDSRFVSSSSSFPLALSPESQLKIFDLS